MVFFIVGTNISKKKTIIDSFTKRYNPSSVLRYDDVSFSTDTADNFLQNSFLDTDTYLIEVDHLFSSFGNIFIPYLKFFHQSNHIFVFYEYEISKEIHDSISAYIIESVLEVKKELAKVNPFVLTDYILDKDKKNAWICLYDLKKKADTVQISSALLWAFKTLSLVLGTSNPTESSTGLKPFVLSKMKQKAKKWSREEAVLGYQTILSNQSKEIFDDDAFLMRIEQYIFSL